MIDSAYEGRRVAVDKDVANFVKSLNRATGDSHAPFATIADVLAFAAAFGAERGGPTPLSNPSKSPDPIRMSVFHTRGHDALIELLAVDYLDDVNVLRDSVDAQDRRTEVFENYANTGLREMVRALKGHADQFEGLELLLAKYRPSTGTVEAVDDDLSQLIDQ